MRFKKHPNMLKVLSFILTLTICSGGAYTGTSAAAPNHLPENTSVQDTGAKAADDIAFHLTSNGQHSITQSGSFEANDNQILTITILSDIKNGSVDLFLFSPDSKEQRITLSGSDETKTVALSNGRWAYNCTGFFESGTISISGTVSPAPNNTPDSANPTSGTEDSSAVVINLGNDAQNSITQSGSFEANDNQILTITILSDIKNGSVDLFLFSPDSKEQRITLSGSDETKTVALSNGRWAYNCTGFFESGTISIIGKIE